MEFVRIGQPATVVSDLYGKDAVFHGKVIGLGAGTGSVFSLLPAQNATGGTLKIKVLPGKYGAVTLKNDSLVRDDFLHNVIDHALAGSELIHKDQLERAMLLISDLRGAGMPRMAVAAGRQPETSDLAFDVPPTPRVDGFRVRGQFRLALYWPKQAERRP